MSVKTQIEEYIATQTEAKRHELQILHDAVLQWMTGCKLWFLDGKDDKGKTVTNPNIGYGTYTIKYKDGSTREFYRVGLSVNTSGISVYIMGIEDKNYLSATWGKKIGKATVTGYCIKFRSLKDIHLDVLKEAIKYRAEQAE